MAKEIKQWITVNHVHIPIFEGETAKDAVKRLKEGARKGKDTRPISKKEYDKKLDKAEKAYKKWGENKERAYYAKRRMETDTSDEAKKELMNANRTEKEAEQRWEQRYHEHQESIKHPKYTSIKVRRKEKPAEQSNKVAESEKAFRIENNRKALKQYQDWEAQNKQKLNEYLDSREYRFAFEEEDRNKARAKKKELEDAIEKNREEAFRMARKLQEDGALPRYSKDREDGTFGRGVILDSTVKADPRYETLSNSLKYKKHRAGEMLRHIMYAEEEGRTSFKDNVYDFMGGDKDYLGRYKPGGYANFGEFLRDYKKAYKELGWKVTASENTDTHSRGYHTARGGYQPASHTQSRMLTFEKIPEKAVKPKAKSPSLDNITDAKNQAELNSKLKERGLSLDAAYQKAHSDDRVTMYDKDGNSYTGTYNQYNDGGREIVNIRKEKSWQDKDAEVKAKQIANAEAQKAERNVVRHYGPEIEDEQFRKDALAEMRRYKSNWDFYTAKEKRNISPEGLRGIDTRIKEIEDYEKNLKKGSTTNGSKEVTKRDLMMAKGATKIGNYNVEVGRNMDGSIGKRTAVWTDELGTGIKYFNSPEKALEFVKKKSGEKTSKWSKDEVSYAKQVIKNISSNKPIHGTLGEMTPTYLKIVAGAGYDINTDGMTKQDIIKAICDKAGLDYKVQKVGYKQVRRGHRHL